MAHRTKTNYKIEVTDIHGNGKSLQTPQMK